MKTGDSVSVIDDDLKGVIISVKGNTVAFRDAHGFIHQYPKEQVVPQVKDIYQNIKPIIKKDSTKPVSKKHQRKHLVLDLHFENLVKNPADYDSFERLLIQKEKLAETVEFCRTHRLKKLEVIHGIGDGVLQRMVHDYLSAQAHIEFEDHDFFYHHTGSVLVRFT